MQEQDIKKIIYKIEGIVYNIKGVIVTEDENFIVVYTTKKKHFRLNKKIILQIKDAPKELEGCE